MISPFAMGASHADSTQTSCCSTPRGTEGHPIMAPAAHEEVCPCRSQVAECTVAVLCEMPSCWCAWSCVAAVVLLQPSSAMSPQMCGMLHCTGSHPVADSARHADLHTPLWHLPVPRHSRGSDSTSDLKRRARRQEICIRVCKSQEGTCSPGRHGPPGSASSGQKRFCYQAMRACTAVAVGPFAHSQ